MAILSTPRTTSGRTDIGGAVMEAAKHVDLRPVKTRFDRFKKVHLAHERARSALAKSRARLGAQQMRVAELDVTQDEVVDALATALAGEGLPRSNPLKAFGGPSPSTLKDLGYGAEAVKLLALVKKVKKRRGLSAATLQVATAAERAALAVQAAVAKIPALQKAVAAGRLTRDALAQPWETAYAALKRGARSAEDDGAPGLFAALFEPSASTSVGKPAATRHRSNGVRAADAATPAPRSAALPPSNEGDDTP